MAASSRQTGMNGITDDDRAISVAGSIAPPPPTSFELPAGYKAKRCKYCRVFSTAATPVPEGVFPSFDPLIAWAAGKRERPKGLVCRICLTAPQLTCASRGILFEIYAI